MRTLRLATVLFGVAFSLALPAAAGPFPPTIPLPNGFLPEGIAIGNGTTFYAGSRANGAVYRGDLRTGVGSILVSGQPGRVSVGLDFNGGLLYVAGGPTGKAYVYNAATGAPVADYQLTTSVSFVNDVVVTKDAAYFTDSFQPVLYRVPLGGAPGSEVLTIPLGGDFTQVGGFNTNGIDATPDGKRLVIVHSGLGVLYTVDPASGLADQIELSGGDVARGDGILLDGKTLYVVQNTLNQVAVVALRPDLSAGVIVDHKTNPAFEVPTTIDEHGNRLYAVNAKLTTSPTPDTTYSVVQFSKK